MDKIIENYEWADSIISISPSCWADIPGQFKVFIDRCTPWCNTHEPHATLKAGKKGYVVALRTGTSMRECQRIFESIEHFYGHLEIECCERLGLCSVEYKMRWKKGKVRSQNFVIRFSRAKKDNNDRLRNSGRNSLSSDFAEVSKIVERGVASKLILDYELPIT